jgi:5-methylcytosine-specific restriction endonuclease McrA
VTARRRFIRPARARRVRTADEQRQSYRVRDRERRGARGYDGITDEQIYRRDKWVCLMEQCLCPDGPVIDPALAGTGDPWAPSIDHVIPIGSGGLDCARNKRAAHARCNNNANEQEQRDLVPLRAAGWPAGPAGLDTLAAEGVRLTAIVGAEVVKALLSLRDTL